MNELEHLLKQNNIEGILFDLDDTLISTYETMVNQWKVNSALMIAYLKDNYDYEIEFKKFLDIYHKTEIEEYKSGDVSFISRFPDIVRGLSRTLEVDIKQQEFIDHFLPYIAKIYDETPEPFDGALECLHSLRNFTVLICTHSGDEWTKLKIDYLRDLYFKKFHQELNVLTHSINLNKAKDSKEWGKAIQLTGIKASDLIAVGDSFNSDILPAIEAGIEHLVWITKNSKDKNNDVNRIKELGKHVEIIKNISNLNELITSNQLFEDI